MPGHWLAGTLKKMDCLLDAQWTGDCARMLPNNSFFLIFIIIDRAMNNGFRQHRRR